MKVSISELYRTFSLQRSTILVMAFLLPLKSDAQSSSPSLHKPAHPSKTSASQPRSGATASASHSKLPATHRYLPRGTVFRGNDVYAELLKKAEKENWRSLPLGSRTVMVGKAMLGTPYVNFTLEIDDRIESPSVNFRGQDCWTFFEISLAFARMIKAKPVGPYSPDDLLACIEIERYRHGKCNGNYLSRIHHLEELFADNQRRGLGTNLTASLGGVRIHRNIREMQIAWKSYRYLKNNPELRKGIAQVERYVSGLPVYHIPKSKVAAIESKLQDGDVIAITTTDSSAYTSHVGLAVKMRDGTARFMHATSSRDKGRRVILDQRISQYLAESKSRAGIIVFRPKDL